MNRERKREGEKGFYRVTMSMKKYIKREKII